MRKTLYLHSYMFPQRGVQAHLQIYDSGITFSAIIFITMVPFMECGASPAAGQNKSTAMGIPPSLMQIILGKPQCQVFV